MPILVAAGIDVNAPSLGQTPLTAAVTEDAVEAAAWLLDHGADVDGRASDADATPLHEAVTEGNLEFVKLLLDRGADPNLSLGNPARNAVAAARFWGNEEIAEYLESRGYSERAEPEPEPVDVEAPAFRKRDTADHVEWFEKKWWHVYDYGTRRGLPAMRRKNRVFFLVGYLIDQVHNGGVESFYENPSAEYAPQLPEALDAIGATRAASAVREINALYPGGGPAADAEARARQMRQLAKAMSKLGARLERIVVERGAKGGRNVLLAQLYDYYHG